MFNIGSSEFLLLAVVALVVIGPRDLPKAMRVLGYWVGKARGVSRQFRSGFDAMVREAELAEMEKKWAEENARIMAEHGVGAEVDGSPGAVAHDTAASCGIAPPAPSDGATSPDRDAAEPDLFAQPVMVEKPVVAPAEHGPAADAKANS